MTQLTLRNIFYDTLQFRVHPRSWRSPALHLPRSGLCGTLCPRSVAEEPSPTIALSTALWSRVSDCICSADDSNTNKQDNMQHGGLPFQWSTPPRSTVCVSACVSIADSVFSVEVGGNETQFTLSELEPNQVYRVRIAAGTGIGFGVPSDWVQHQTLARYDHSDHSICKIWLLFFFFFFP